MPTDRNGNSAMTWCDVVKTSRPPQTIMKRLIAAISPSATRSTARRGAEKGQDDAQEDRHRLRPGCGAVEHIASVDAPRDDQRDDDEGGTGNDGTRPIEGVHGAAEVVREPLADCRFSYPIVLLSRRRLVSSHCISLKEPRGRA